MMWALAMDEIDAPFGRIRREEVVATKYVVGTVTDEQQDELVAETVAWLNAIAAARYEPVDIPEDAWEDLRVPSDEGSDG